jgi:anti-sigma factor RsiW
MPDSLSEPNRKLTCEEVRDELHSLVMNELEEWEAEPILIHLAGCRACRQALSEHAQLAGALSEHMPALTHKLFKPYYRYN